jgi:hypothetical protein
MGIIWKFIILLFGICNLLNAEVRYVSHSGSNTPPYLTWETAADSIMSAVNISSFGDTIYVANGVYEEQVVMIPGLSLIGAGMDSCFIDTRNLVTSQTFFSVGVADSCHFTGFQILTFPTSYWGYAIGALEGNTKSWIYNNKVTYGRYGVFINNLDTSNHSEIQIFNNIFNNVSQGVHLFTTNATVRNNLIYIDPNSQAIVIAGVSIGAYFFNLYPLIDSNYIEVCAVGGRGVSQSYGARLTIRNNTIKLVHGDKGIFLGDSDSSKVFNNLIIGAPGNDGLTDGNQHLEAYNNVAINLSGAGFQVGNNISTGIIKNNMAIHSGRGFEKMGNPVIQYNNSWNNNINYNGFNPDTTNLSVNPMVVNTDTSQGDLDFHLQMFSPLIDRGDPNILDKDSTRSDIGLYGGPYGELYLYRDLPPGAPVNLTASLDTNYILLKWNKNTEADFSHYDLYRDTTENFTIDSTTFVTLIPDTFYLQMIPQGIDNLYFKLTAVDNQGNESDPSGELHVFLTGIINNEKLTINNYRLYQNYPNPFNPSTKIGYRLKERGYVKLYVYDIKGELVETLVNRHQEAGYYEADFNSRNLINQIPTNNLASGVYIYQIMVRNDKGIPVFSDMRKMVLVK